MNRLEQLKMYDVITFDEDDKVIVLAKQDYNGRKYVFVNEVLPDESDVTDIYKVMEIHLEDSTLERVIDPKVLQEILPLFRKQLENFETESEERTDRNDRIFGTFKESDSKLYTVEDYERIVKKAMATQDIEPLIEHSEKMICSNKPSALRLNKEFTYTSWCEFLNKNGSEWACNYLFNKYAVIGDYDMVSWTKECFIEGLKERGEYVAPILYYQVGYYKYMQINDDLPMEQMIQLYEGKILAAGQWYKRAMEAGYDLNAIADGKWCIDYYDTWEKKHGGCNAKNNVTKPKNRSTSTTTKTTSSISDETAKKIQSPKYSTAKHFFNLIGRLVQWGKREKDEPLKLLDIHITWEKNYDNIYRIKVIGKISDTSRTIDSFVKEHADPGKYSIGTPAQNFYNDMLEWFDLGNAAQPDGEIDAFIQMWGTFDNRDDLVKSMKALKQMCEKYYPNTEINFHIPIIESSPFEQEIDYFVSLMEILIDWYNNYKGLELRKIEIREDYNYTYSRRLIVIGYISDSEKEIQSCISIAKKFPDGKDGVYCKKLMDWFELGNPNSPSGEVNAFYQYCGSFSSKKELIAIMKVFRDTFKEEYPNIPISFIIPEEEKDGCYIATAVYGSYNCPEVWTLRRFRDDVLRRYKLGILFVKFYYKMSPVLVKRFGEEDWFNKIFKYILDSFVNKLNSKGIENTQYYDK